LNLKISEGCNGTVTLSGTECNASPEFGSACQGPASFPIFTEGQIVKAGTTATYVDQMPAVGSFGEVMMTIVTAGSALSKGTLSLTLNGFHENGLNVGASSVASLDGAAATGKVSLIARRLNSFVFTVSNTGTDDFTLSKVNYMLQRCPGNKGGPDCTWVVSMIVPDYNGWKLTYDPTNSSFCQDLWCYFFISIDWQPTISFQTNGTYPDIYFQKESLPSVTEFDIFFSTSGHVAYSPNYLLPSMDVLGIHRKNKDKSTVTITFSHEAPTPNPAPPVYSPGKIAGFVVLGVVVTGLIIAGAVYLYKRKRHGYEPVQ